MINTPRHVTNIQHEKNVVYMFLFISDVMMQDFLGDHYVHEKHANEGPKVANANGGAQGS